MIHLGIIVFALAVFDAAITLFFALKKEKDSSVRYNLAYGSIFILLVGLGALFFELKLTSIAITVLYIAWIMLMATSIRKMRENYLNDK